MHKNEAFDRWAEEHKEKLLESWEKRDNTMIEWFRYYWTLRKAFEAGQQHGNTTSINNIK